VQIGTVTSKFVADVAGHLKGVAQVSAANLKNNETLRTVTKSTVAFGKTANETITGIRMFREEIGRVTDKLGGNAKQYLVHQQAVRQYKNEMAGATRSVAAFNKEAGNTSDLSKQLTNLVGVGASLALITEGVARLKAFAMEAVRASAEVETLDRVLATMGKNSGYSIGFLRDQVEELRVSGIEAAASARGITDFLKTGLPLDRIKELSKLAQDLAVIGGTNSTESFQRITWGITTGQTDVLRVAGLNVSFETAYAKAAQSMGKAVNSLTEAEKLQARLMEVMKQAPQVAGAYDSAMQTAGKQLSSMPRLIDDVRVALGDALLPVFTKSIFAVNNFLKAIRALIEEGPLGDWIQRQATVIAAALARAATSFTAFIEGADLTPFLMKIESVIGVVQEFGKVGMAAAAGIGSKFLGMIPIIGKIIAPFTGWQVAIAGFIISNEKLRKGVWEVVVALYEAAQRIAGALIPALQSVTQAIGGSGDAFGNAAHFIARQIELYSTFAVLVINTVVPALRAFISVIKFVGQVLLASPLAQFTRWLLQLVGGTETARFAILSLALAAKVFIGTLISGFKTAGVMAALDGISRTMRRLNGETDAFNGFLSQTATRFKTAAIMAGVYAVAAMAIAFAMQKMAQYQADVQKKTEQLFAGAKAEGGLKKVSSVMRERILELSASTKEYNDSVNLIDNTNNRFVRAMDIFGSIIPGGQGMKNILQGNLNPFAQISQAWEGWSKGVEIEAIQKATEGFFEEIVSDLKDGTQSLRSDTAKLVEELKGSQEAISRAVGNFGVQEGTFSRLTPGMTKALEDSLAQINQQVDAWAEDFTSIGHAMLDKEVEGWDDLMAFYDRQLQRTAAFFAGLDLLKAYGAPQSLIDELLKGGAEKFGAAMQDLMVQSVQMGPEATKQMIATLSQQKTMADNIVNYNKEKYAALALQSDEYQQKLKDEAAVAQKATDDLIKNQIGSLDELKGSYDFLSTAILGSANMSTVQKNEAQAAIAAMMGMIDSARAAISQGEIIDAEGLRTQFQNILKLLPADMLLYGQTAMNQLNAVISSNRELVSTAGNLGKAAGSNLGANMANEASKSLRELGKKLMDSSIPTAHKLGLSLMAKATEVDKLAQANAEAAAAAQNLAVITQAGQGGNLYPKQPEKDTQADQMAKNAEDAAKRIADVYKNNPPLKLFGEAMDEVWGKQIRFANASHAMADAGEDLAAVIKQNASSSDTWNRKQRLLEDAIIKSVSTIREEVEAMADMGLIGNSVGDMARATADKIDELKASLPGLVAGMDNVSGAAKTMEETLSDVHAAIDKSLGRFLSAEEATYAVEEQIDRLNSAYNDQVDLLTNTALEGKDVRDIKRSTNKELIAAVRAIQAEAKALAENGEIGADAASQTAFMTEKLKELEKTYPELKPQIQDYIRQLEQIPSETNTESKVYIDGAIAALDWYKVKLAQVPAIANTTMTVLVNDAAIQNAVGQAQQWNGLRSWDLGVEQQITSQLQQQGSAMEYQNALARNAPDVLLKIWGAGGGVRVMDSGGVLTPGMTNVMNASGQNEFVFTGEQVRALHNMGFSGQAGGVVGGGGSSVTIGNMTVIPREPPRQWFDEALWRAARGFGAGAGTNGQTEEGWS
jgi:cellobiose-specific phosphotransferase system component IIA